MPRKDICETEGCNRWITSRRLDKGHSTCSKHEKQTGMRWEIPHGINMGFWRSTVRPAVLKRANYKCEECGGTRRLCVHHESYEEQTIDNFKVLCFACHTLHHRQEKK